MLVPNTSLCQIVDAFNAQAVRPWASTLYKRAEDSSMRRCSVCNHGPIRMIFQKSIHFIQQLLQHVTGLALLADGDADSCLTGPFTWIIIHLTAALTFLHQSLSSDVTRINMNLLKARLVRIIHRALRTQQTLSLYNYLPAVRLDFGTFISAPT